jgi:hypothetical protein
MYLGDDFHHNGAFRLSYGLEYSARMETSKQNEAFDFGLCARIRQDRHFKLLS